MKNSILVILLSFALLLPVYGQEKKAPNPAEMEQKLSTATGQEKLSLLIDLGIYYSERDPKKSLQFGESALSVAQQLNDLKSQGKIYQIIGNGYNQLENGEAGLKNFLAAAEIYQKLGDDSEVARSNLYVGQIYYHLGKFQLASERLKDTLAYYQNKNILRGISVASQQLGNICLEQGDFKQGLNYLLNALQADEKSNNKLFIANDLNSIGNIYDSIKNYDKARQYGQNALKLFKEVGNKFGISSSLGNIGKSYWEQGKQAEALQYYQQSLQIATEIDNKYLMSCAQSNIANYLMNNKRYDEALQYCLQALKTEEALRRPASYVSTYVNLADIYFLKNMMKEAVVYYLKAIAIAKELKANEVLKKIYQQMSDFYYNTGKYKMACDYLREYEKVKDEILNVGTTAKIAEMQEKYEADKKQKQIALLTKDNELLKKNGEIQKLNLSRSRLQLLLLIVTTLLFLLVLALFFRKYRDLMLFWRRKSFVGRYRLEHIIGSGAMSVVYQAYPATDKEKKVAIKVIREEYAADPELRKRFINEATIIDSLNHPNIVKVFERGEFNESLYITMEYIAGATLADYTVSHAPIPVRTVLQIMGQIAAALAKIHSHEILHRDLKPENIMISQADDAGALQVKLLDFGLAKAQHLTRLTQTGMLVGTFGYIPPEQFLHQTYAKAGDIFALGVIFYYLVTLQKPFPGDSEVEQISQIIEKDPLAPEQWRAGLPAACSALILQMLAKKPDDRPSAEQTLAQLAAIEAALI